MNRKSSRIRNHCPLKIILLAITTLLWVSACGNDNSDFRGADSMKGKPPLPLPPPQEEDAIAKPPAPPLPAIERLTWFWQCSPKDALPTSTETNPILVGSGKHSLPYESLPDEIPVVFNGKICEPRTLPRDIVFIVDVSGSMYQNDRTTPDKRCGRIDAVEEFLNYNAGNTTLSYAVATFAHVIRYQSQSFHFDQNSLYKDMESPSDVICSHLTGGTRYDIALRAAETLLVNGRAEATKEIYFLSDGAPEPGHTGVLEADRLKTKGVTIGGNQLKVTIATIMLLGDDLIMEEKIASRDVNGKPLHALVDQAEQLKEALARLSKTEITKAEIRYRLKGGEWNLLEVDLKTLDFDLEPILINKSAALDGIEVKYTYWDSFGRVFEHSGVLTWNVP